MPNNQTPALRPRLFLPSHALLAAAATQTADKVFFSYLN
jgi:hypothetical protein